MQNIAEYYKVCYPFTISDSLETASRSRYFLTRRKNEALTIPSRRGFTEGRVRGTKNEDRECSKDFRWLLKGFGVHLCIPKVVKRDRVYGKVQDNKLKLLEKHSIELTAWTWE